MGLEHEAEDGVSLHVFENLVCFVDQATQPLIFAFQLFRVGLPLDECHLGVGGRRLRAWSLSPRFGIAGSSPGQMGGLRQVFLGFASSC